MRNLIKNKQQKNSEKGSVSTLVLITILTFMAILMGTYLVITALQKSQLKSDLRIQDLYGAEVEKIDEIYNELKTTNIEEELLADVIKVGDYVRYELPNTTYTMTTAQTGYTADQTYDTSTATDLWQVLYNDTTYGVQITSSAPVANLKLNRKWEQSGFNASTALDSGKIGYNNSITTLNTMSSYYVNEKIATSGRSIGSNPLDPTDKVTATVSVAANGSLNTKPGAKLGDNYYTTDFEGMKAATNQNSNGIANIGTDYYLASRVIYQEAVGLIAADKQPLADDMVFCVRNVKADGTTSYAEIFANTDSAGTNYFGWYHLQDLGVRPVVTLKEGLKIISGNGSVTNPYIIH